MKSEPTPAGAAARIEQGLCGPPRVEPLAQDAISEQAWEVIQRLRRLTSFPPDAPAEPFFTTFSHNPGLLEGFMGLGFRIMADGALSPREKELAILRTGWLCNAPFQWGEHVDKARRLGFSGEEIERVKLGSAAEGWTGEERAILQAAEELHGDAMISERTWASLAQWLDEDQLIELPIVVGHYHMTAFLQNSLRIRPTRDMNGQPAPQEAEP